jgi:uncharacterized protein (DUF433 family)
MNYKDFIEIVPGVRFGKPVIKDTRIAIYDIIEMLANEMSIDEILADFPQLSRESIRACLLFASDKERKLSIAS